MQVVNFVAKDGKVTLDVEGVIGKKCEGITQPYQERLGGDSEVFHKDVYHQVELEQNQ